MKTPYTLITVQHPTMEAGLTKNLRSFQFWGLSKKDAIYSLIEQGKVSTLVKYDKEISYWQALFLYHKEGFSNKTVVRELVKEDYPLDFIKWMAALLEEDCTHYLEGKDSFWLARVLADHKEETIVI